MATKEQIEAEANAAFDAWNPLATDSAHSLGYRTNQRKPFLAGYMAGKNKDGKLISRILRCRRRGVEYNPNFWKEGE